MIIEFNGIWPGGCPRVSLCDAQIDRISFSNEAIRFHFPNGFRVEDGDAVVATKASYVEFYNCTAEDFFCTIVKRWPTKDGALQYGKPLSLVELGNMLGQKKKGLEVFLELYDWNYLFWRGSLCPRKKRGLSDWVVLELSDCFPIRFCWE